MCRMLIAVGEVDISWLIDDFILMASDNNEHHENNEDKLFKHGHGWGICYLKGNKLKLNKSIKPCYEDELIHTYKKLNSPFYLLHARRGSQGRGGVKRKNVHPFRYVDYVFCHNGTVNDQLRYDKKFVPKGETDSEQLLYYLLSGLNNGIDTQIMYKKFSAIQDFSGMNCILSDGENSYIVNWYLKKPKYYTLKLLKEKKFIIISSEVLPHFKDGNWQKLHNHDIVKLSTGTKQYYKMSFE